ncbi:DHA2 family efflux MFS transporter permease subunit [Actinomadura sp. KC216]|uniref:MDR family MFS transporter n=1 Tax=Actinomadura sp. KC216 TaxID=2530370 RepID=UPI001051D3D8|nr:MDR family MFS transporter [Actinomadura sp. KC216]TDB90552.1 DHA2 family efflux MFS transporter permease subunit [Actinomadura sp. KC216]
MDKIDARLWRVAFVLVLGTVMATLDGTIVAVAIATLADRFAAPVADVQWVTTAYLLAVVTAVPTSGWLADRFGGRRVWLGAVAAFLAASLLCGLAWSLPSLVVFRVMQGLAGGLLPPVGQALLVGIAGRERTGRVIAVVGVLPLLSPVFGPLVGGAVLNAAGWRWMFLINIPVGVAALALGRRLVPAVPPAATGARFDWRGAALLSPGLAVLVYGLTRVAHDSPAWQVTAALVAGVGMLAGFTLHGVRTKGVPLLDPRLFVRPPFGVAALALLALGASVFGTMFLLPLYLQGPGGLSAWQTGLLLAPQGVGVAAGTVLVTRVVDAAAPRTLVLGGMALVAAGTVAFTRLGHGVPDEVVAGSLFLRGVGAAMISTPIMTLVYRRTSPPQLPRTAVALNLLSMLGGSIGTAALAAVLQARIAARADQAVAFGDAFWWVLGLVVLAATAAYALPRTASADGADHGQRATVKRRHARRRTSATLPQLVDGQLPPGRWVCTVEEAESIYVMGQPGEREAIWSEWRRLTSALRQLVGEVPACWLSGGFFSAKPDPADIDCVYLVDTVKLQNAATNAATLDPRALSFLTATATGRIKDAYGMRVDSYILEWTPTLGTDPEPETKQYLEARGYWDDLWSRVHDADGRLDSVPRRGYLEVIIDGYR